jgi:hypothetical protein
MTFKCEPDFKTCFQLQLGPLQRGGHGGREGPGQRDAEGEDRDRGATQRGVRRAHGQRDRRGRVLKEREDVFERLTSALNVDLSLHASLNEVTRDG